MEGFNRKNRPMKKDDYVKILDVFLEFKNSFNNKELAQGIGTKYYTLLELVPKEGVALKPGQKVYIGDGKRDEILFVKRQIRYDELSNDAKSELIFNLEDIVKENEEKFLRFFNVAGPITLRKHSLEMIPGVGKKHLQGILNERSKGEFKSFEDISKRLSFLQNPARALAMRLEEEIKGTSDIKFLIYWK